MELPEHTLWRKHLQWVRKDAMGFYFRPSDDIEKRFKELKKKKLKEQPFNSKIQTEDARNYILDEQFDKAVEMAGYGQDYVDKTFRLIQKIIRYEKQLLE